MHRKHKLNAKGVTMKTKSALLFILAASIMTAPVPTFPGALAATSQEATPAESDPAKLLVEDLSKPAGFGQIWLEKWMPPIFFEAHFLGLALCHAQELLHLNIEIKGASAD